VIESSRLSFPSSTNIMIAVAVNCLPIEPDWKIRLRRDWHLKLDVRKSVALGENHFAVPHHLDCDAG
jgi:hypothetical protein